jgi:selenide,water dikinase
MRRFGDALVHGAIAMKARGVVAADASAFETDLLLVGGGHAHVQVLRRWMMEPMPGVRLSVVVDRHEAVYSGMVPGLVAGNYACHEPIIDVLPLARRAGARCIHARVRAIDAQARSVILEGRPPIPYDVASVNVGSTVRDLEVPGLSEHGLATRPIGRFVEELEARLQAVASESSPALRVVVVGAGAAGVELAFCIEARLRTLGRPSEVAVITAEDSILKGGHRALAPRVEAAMARRGIALHRGLRVVAAEKDALRLEGGRGESSSLACDLALWATGPAAHDFLAASSLPCDDRGFLRVRSTLQVEGYDDLFAAGDCARLIDHPWVPRAGVYAVRAGPALDANLRARIRGRAVGVYRPQRDFLALLNLGDHRAIGGKWGRAIEGRWVWRLKDYIDRRFMRGFQVLDAGGRPARDFPSPAAMDEEEMECGGCAAKVGPSPLRAALARLDPAPEDSSVQLGLAEADDAAAFALPKGEVVLATLDAFRAFADDPWLVGRVAAVNAASDVYAKGGRPRHALALVTVPERDPRREAETLYQVLAGVRAALDPLGISLVGGHSTMGSELFVGLSLTGTPGAGGRLLGLDGLVEGDRLILTKPLGTGLLLAADARGLAPARWIEALTRSLIRPNAQAARLAVEFEASACTDVSGFGLAGHLHEMLEASDVGAQINGASLGFLPGALDLAARGLRSTYHDQNASLSREIAARSGPAESDAEWALLFDPQTSGGLLMGVPGPRAESLLGSLHEAGDDEAAIIGEITAAPSSPGPRIRYRASGFSA